MGSAFHQLCPIYSGTLTHSAPTAIRLWESFTLFFSQNNPQKTDLDLPDCFAREIFYVMTEIHATDLHNLDIFRKRKSVL